MSNTLISKMYYIQFSDEQSCTIMKYVKMEYAFTYKMQIHV